MNMPNLASWNQRRAARFSMAGWYGADFPGRAKAAAAAKRSICLLVMAVTSDLNAKRAPAAGGEVLDGGLVRRRLPRAREGRRGGQAEHLSSSHGSYQ